MIVTYDNLWYEQALRMERRKFYDTLKLIQEKKERASVESIKSVQGKERLVTF